jgi:hypothetical protein
VQLGAHPELHGSGQQELQPRVPQPPRRRREDLRHAADQQRRREQPAHESATPQRLLLALARGLFSVHGVGIAGRRRGRQLVPGGRDGRLQRVYADQGRIERQRGLLRRQVDGRGVDTRHPGQRTFHLGDAGGAVHSAHGQGEPLRHHRAPKRLKTSSSSSTFC